MVIKFTCLSCDAHLTAPDSVLGQQAPCPKCGTIILAKDEQTAIEKDEIIEFSMKDTVDEKSVTTKPEIKTCKYCGEEIKLEAVFCKHCKHYLINKPIKSDFVTSPGFQWKQWTIGRRIIFISACLQVLSLDFDFIMIIIILLKLFLLFYPCLMLFRGKRISLLWGLMCSLLAVILHVFLYRFLFFSDNVVNIIWPIGIGIGIIQDHLVYKNK